MQINTFILLTFIHNFICSISSLSMNNIYQKLRNEMVGILVDVYHLKNKQVLSSMSIVPRHLFVDHSNQNQAYDDHPLPIGHGQTISQPYIVALMASEAYIQSTDNVLEIGTGCGYAAAVLSNIAGQVYTVETIKELGDEAKQRLQDLEYKNVHVRVGDGSIGWIEHAPYDAILVACAAPEVPKSLISQLAINGRLVIPVRKNGFEHEELVRITRKSENEYHKEFLLDVRFVPLVGKEGYTK